MAKVYMDEANGRHVTVRIMERIPKEDQARVVNVVKKLMTLEAPAQAVGDFQWHVNVAGVGRIVLRGHSIRTVYSFNENFPNSPEFKIESGRLIRA